MIYLNIGSNLKSIFGDKIKNLNKAIEFIKKEKIKIIRTSNYYQTPSYPNTRYPKFVNMCLKIETSLKPSVLLVKLKKIEIKLGRLKTSKNLPRVCDIDIIDYKGKNVKIGKLILPHPRMHLRNFVLFPLKEIEPSWSHPKNKKNIGYLVNGLRQKSRLEITRLKKSAINIK